MTRVSVPRPLALEEFHVTSILIAIFVAILTFGSGILGFFFENWFPRNTCLAARAR